MRTDTSLSLFLPFTVHTHTHTKGSLNTFAIYHHKDSKKAFVPGSVQSTASKSLLVHTGEGTET